MLLFNKTYILEGGGLYQALDVEESNLYKETHINSRGCVFFQSGVGGWRYADIYRLLHIRSRCKTQYFFEGMSLRLQS